MIPRDRWDDEAGCLHVPKPVLMPPVVQCIYCGAVGAAWDAGNAHMGVRWAPETEPKTRAGFKGATA